MLTIEFGRQVRALQTRFEMATLESALAFLEGAYQPSRDLCLLTFDDGLKEHYREITPLLAESRIQGLFFVITSCLGGRYLAPVHMNHFLMASLEFDAYRNMFLAKVSDTISDAKGILRDADLCKAQRLYRWDSPEVASFKYLCNFVLDIGLREQILKNLFEDNIGDIGSFARTLYLNPQEAREMQRSGMLIGGHSHEHKPLSSLGDTELELDLNLCREILTGQLHPQSLWPFCYPYGKKDSFNSATKGMLRELGFVCSFSTEVGCNTPGTDPFALRRVDCKDTSVL
jgi:peptidoglycan/xylan/chitin deacetylase (PgdA/CDA1 family)